MPVSATDDADSLGRHHSRSPVAGSQRDDSGLPTTAVPLSCLEHVAVGSVRSVFETIRGPAINLAIWQRRLPADIAAQIDAAGPDGFAYVDERFDVGEGADVVAAWLSKSRLAGALGRWLAGDIGALLEDTARLGNAARLRLKIETVVDTKCSRFHSDMTLLRLITAYHGAATEFVADAIADDVFLRDRMPPPEQILGAPRDSVCLLRGAMPAEGFAGRAIVHRSPDIHRPEDWRLLVTVDALID